MAFEQFGFFKDYYVLNKFIGSQKCEDEGREIGYSGRRVSILENDVICWNKKKIKKGVEVMTIIYPLCGRIVKAA